MKDKDCLEMVYGLKHVRKEVSDPVCRLGERGDTFYIIIKGKCGVWLPVPPNK